MIIALDKRQVNSDLVKRSPNKALLTISSNHVSLFLTDEFLLETGQRTIRFRGL